MIFSPTYTWPAWVSQVSKSVVSFAVGYVYIMKDVPHTAWFNWDALFMGLIASGLYHGGLMTQPFGGTNNTVSPVSSTQAKSS